MTTRAVSSDLRMVDTVKKERAAAGSRFDWIVVAISTWLMGGGYSDGWAHNHLPIDNFFTPWHGAFYSGFLIICAFMVGTFIRNRMKGYPAHLAMPSGYELSLLGVVVIFFGGIGDMFWHMLFGIELSINGALSPTHIAVSIGLGLVVSGPFRAAWQRSKSRQGQSFVELLPMLLSLTYLLGTITIIAQFSHPFVHTWPAGDRQDPFSYQALAIVSIVLQTIILMGLVLLTVRRWQLPFGAFTLVFTLNMLMLSVMQDTYLLIPVAALGGLVADVLVWRLKPSIKEPNALRIFAFIVPVALYLFYFLALELTSGVKWSVNLWLGSTFAAGLAGLFLSYLLIPPTIPASQEVDTKVE
jgi:hypothetical protein